MLLVFIWFFYLIVISYLCNILIKKATRWWVTASTNIIFQYIILIIGAKCDHLIFHVNLLWIEITTHSQQGSLLSNKRQNWFFCQAVKKHNSIIIHTKSMPITICATDLFMVFYARYREPFMKLDLSYLQKKILVIYLWRFLIPVEIRILDA